MSTAQQPLPNTAERRQADLSGACLAEVSAGIVQLYRRYYGRGPTRAKTIAHDGVMTTVLEEIFTTVERTLVEHDRGELVARVRDAFQEAMAREFIAVVETITGRRVAAYSSGVDVRCGAATETFLFVEEEPLGRIHPQL